MSKLAVKKRRGELTRIFLENTNELAGDAQDHLVAFLNARHGTSVSGLEYAARSYRRQRLKNKATREEEQKLRQRYYVMLHNLKKAGLVIARKRGNEAVLTITHRGELKLKSLKKELADMLVIPIYKMESGSRVLIVAFDIPETKRAQRKWLRSALKSLGFRMIQQSVWVGKGVLPRNFIEDLRKAELIDFVEIFEVTKSGTLELI